MYFVQAKNGLSAPHTKEAPFQWGQLFMVLAVYFIFFFYFCA
jgi:hypothetical protein